MKKVIEYTDSVLPGGRTGPRSLGREAPRIIIQKPDTSICGQTCVAMALDILPERAAELMGARAGGTRVKQVVKALSQYYDVDNKLYVIKSGLPQRSICKVIISKNRSHYILNWDGFIYDPSWGVFHKDQYSTHIKAFDCRISSALEIRENYILCYVDA